MENQKKKRDKLKFTNASLLYTTTNLFIEQKANHRQSLSFPSLPPSRNGRYTIRSVGKRSILAKIPSNARNIFDRNKLAAGIAASTNLSLLNRL